MKLDHTPGPWKVVSSGRKYHWPIIEIGKVEVIINTEKHCEADARLIAHAPDMLEELIICFSDGMEGYQMREEPAIKIKNLLESATGKTIMEILK